MAVPDYTVERLIKQALVDGGRLQRGATPSSEVYDDCLNRLTDLINIEQTQGLKLWLNAIQSIVLVAGQASYTLGPGSSIITVKPTRVLEGWFVQSSGARTPLTSLSWNEYYALGNVGQQGAVNSYFTNKQAANLIVSLWQVPDAQAATGTVQLLIQQQATAPTQLSDTLSFPIEWFMWARWALADDLSSGQPAVIMDRCAQKAMYYKTILEDWDVEDVSTRFQPDPQLMGLRASGFR